jgi:lipopolysaccharide export system permease protein
MLQNKIYQNFFIEIIKTFLIILFGLSLVALTVRAVSFLELIVENGYPVLTYFQYSLLNLFGIAPKFIPLSFLVALTLFIVKHSQDSEFIILWTSGVEKIQVVNLFICVSITITAFYLIFSTFLSPLALNKSRQLLSQDNLNSFLPTVRTQEFSDSFKGFTFFVEKKFDNELQNIFLNDKNNVLKNLSSNTTSTNNTTIVANNGFIESQKIFLFDGQIISSKNNGTDTEIIKFEQLNVDLSGLSTTTIKKPKLQELPTLKLINCFTKNSIKSEICNQDFKKEIIPNLSRRIILPLYIPVVALLCSFLLIKTDKKQTNRSIIFLLSFILLLSAELIVRYTGIYDTLIVFFFLFPFLLLLIFYFFLILKFSKEAKNYE